MLHFSHSAKVTTESHLSRQMQRPGYQLLQIFDTLNWRPPGLSLNFGSDQYAPESG